MKYLGIDYGTKRTGIAISDDDGRLAFPLKVVLTNNRLSHDIGEIVQNEKVHVVVLGESRNLAGEMNPVMKQIAQLRIELETHGISVTYEREFYSSQQAARLQGENAMHDASAAAVILQSYLDKQKKSAVDNDPYKPL